ncbi:hypothetical protein J6590_043321, partial [Homalodisca vitripennis]
LELQDSSSRVWLVANTVSPEWSGIMFETVAAITRAVSPLTSHNVYSPQQCAALCNKLTTEAGGLRGRRIVPELSASAPCVLDTELILSRWLCVMCKYYDTPTPFIAILILNSP